MMPITHRLNDFQEKAKEAINSLVSAYNNCILLSVAGEKETFLSGEVHNCGLAIWVYDDEIEFKFREKHLLLERPDFLSLEIMLQHFLDELEKQLKTARRAV